MALGNTIDLGWTKVSFTKNNRAKRMNLRYCNKLKHFKATIPKYGTQKALHKFVIDHQSWMREVLDKIASVKQPIIENSITMMGEKFVIHRNSSIKRTKFSLNAREIFIPDDSDNERVVIESIVRVYSRTALLQLVEKWAEVVGVKFSGFAIADPKSRWGSCSSHGRIMLSWRLVLATPFVADYVALHEVCHLIHMNHSKEFWSLVEKHFPHYKDAVKWLKVNGKGLFLI